MNRRNYQKELEAELSNIEKEGRAPTLFLHSCCAPCSKMCIRDRAGGGGEPYGGGFPMISSTKNDQVKMVVELRKKAKARNEAGLFVAEGLRMVSELPPDRAWRLYVSESFLKNRENAGPVSYTHLDVYKRQVEEIGRAFGLDEIGLDKDCLLYTSRCV